MYNYIQKCSSDVFKCNNVGIHVLEVLFNVIVCDCSSTVVKFSNVAKHSIVLFLM